ncbi:MAG: hypothetical protein AAGD25_06780 [Cyanobacteria bacterium P01_F01_bin.150]
MTEQNQDIRVEARTASDLCKEILELDGKRKSLSQMLSEADKQLERLFKQLRNEYINDDHEMAPTLVEVDGEEYILLRESAGQTPNIINTKALRRLDS